MEIAVRGHHYAFANTYTGGQTAGVTPTFRGAEPMLLLEANGRTYQPMAQEYQAFAALLGSLSSRERAAALLPTAFHDVLLGPGQDGQFPATRQGLRVGELSAAQQQVVLAALKLYVNDLHPVTATAVLAGYQAQLADTYVAYAGSGTMAQAGDYVRLDGPRLWLEYSTQPSRDFPGTVHPHSVWRDRLSDYGGNFFTIVTGTKTTAAAQSFSVFPNPTSPAKALQVQLTMPATYTLRNVLGQTVATQAFKGNAVEVATVGLKAGPYLLSLEVDGNAPATHRFVV